MSLQRFRKLASPTRYPDPDVTPGEDSDDADGEVGVLDGCFSNASPRLDLCPVLRMAGAADGRNL